MIIRICYSFGIKVERNRTRTSRTSAMTLCSIKSTVLSIFIMLLTVPDFPLDWLNLKPSFMIWNVIQIEFLFTFTVWYKQDAVTIWYSGCCFTSISCLTKDNRCDDNNFVLFRVAIVFIGRMRRLRATHLYNWIKLYYASGMN